MDLHSQGGEMGSALNSQGSEILSHSRLVQLCIVTLSRFFAVTVAATGLKSIYIYIENYCTTVL